MTSRNPRSAVCDSAANSKKLSRPCHGSGMAAASSALATTDSIASVKMASASSYLFAKCRYAVPTPSPACRATSSRLASRPRSAKTLRPAWTSSARLRAASLRSGREAAAGSVCSLICGLPPGDCGSEYDSAGNLVVVLRDARTEHERADDGAQGEDARGPPEAHDVAVDGRVGRHQLRRSVPDVRGGVRGRRGGGNGVQQRGTDRAAHLLHRVDRRRRDARVAGVHAEGGHAEAGREDQA